MNTLFNPFEYEKILTPPDATPWSKALHHAGGLALGYGGLALVLRKLLQKSEELDKQKTEGRLRAYAAAKYPTISPDLRIDPEEERRMEAPGVEEEEELPELTKAAGSELTGIIANPVGQITKKTMRGRQDTAHLALAAAAAVMGSGAGWRLADYLEDKKRRDALARKVDVSADEIDRLLHEELQKKNQKVAALGPDEILGDPYAMPTRAPRGTGGSQEPGWLSTLASPGNLLQGAGTVWWLWAVATFALTYKAAKAYGEAKDPNRQRLKQLQEVMKERAKVKDAPVLMAVSEPGGVPRTRNITGEQVQPRKLPQAPVKPKELEPPQQPRNPLPKDLKEDMGKAPETDKDDPYAHLLTT